LSGFNPTSAGVGAAVPSVVTFCGGGFCPPSLDYHGIWLKKKRLCVWFEGI